MDLKKVVDDFNKRWCADDPTEFREEFLKFKCRVLNSLDEIDQALPEDQKRIYWRIYGFPSGKSITSHLQEEGNDVNFYRLLQCIFSLKLQTLSGYGGRVVRSRDIFYSRILEDIRFSRINLASVRLENDDIVFYPAGEEILDSELVDWPLSFLEKVSGTHYVTALKSYQEHDFIKSAESLRRSLEEYLKCKLGNSAGLQANIKEVGKRLKDESRPAQARNIIFSVLSYLDQYYNDESKHNDGDLEEPDNEFLIYQSGLLIRFLSKVL